MYRTDPETGCHTNIVSEIDVIDQCCDHSYYDCNSTGSGYGFEPAEIINGDCIHNGPEGHEDFVHPSVLCNSYHKYAVEWNSDRLIYYFDDIPYWTVLNTSNIDPMRTIIDLQVENDLGYGNFYQNSTWPQSMLVDYLYYYRLRTTDCNNPITFQNIGQIRTFWTLSTAGVISDITFGDNSAPITLDATNYIFRAVNSFTINGEFTVNTGTELTLMPTPCD
jgi:beta-glucanase (GH16 family)